MSTLDNILEQSRQLQATCRISSLHPCLGNIRYDLSELIQYARAIADHADIDHPRMHYLLSSSGANPGQTQIALSSISLRDVAVPVISMENDVTSYIRQVREDGILALVSGRRRQAEADFRKFVEENLSSEWPDRQRRLIKRYKAIREADHGHRELKNHGSEPVSRRRELGLNIRLKDMIPEDDRELSWTAKEQTFSQAISSLNEHRIMKQPIAISSLMSQLTRSLGSELRVHQIADSWQMLAFIVNEKHVEYGKITVGKMVRPRQYMQDYVLGKSARTINNMIVDGSRRYLETQFHNLMEREIARNPHQARLGGTPTMESKAKAFVNLHLSKNGTWTMPNLEIVNGVPIWAVLFYLLRAGHLTQAVQYSLKNEAALQKVEKNWCTYISSYAADPGRKLPRQLADHLQVDYNLRMKFASSNPDPYKQAIYKIIGRCDLTHKTLSQVLPVTEDWLWLQLCLVQENDQVDIKSEKYNLGDLQAILVHYGEQHFNSKGSNPLLYFQVLLLSGQFERATQYLCNHSWTDAVHISIVLAYYGLLKVVPEGDSKVTDLLLDESGTAHLRFSSLIACYAAQIQRHSPTAAVEYISLICLNADVPATRTEEANMCHSVLRTLILETRDFATLLGDIKADGAREPGFVERRLTLLELHDEKQYLRTIAEQAAAISEREGRIADSILLYHLAEEYDLVVALINDFLGESLIDGDIQHHGSDDIFSKPDVEHPAVLAKNMLALYRENSTIFSSVSQRNRSNCETLLAVIHGQQHFAAGRYDACLAAMDDTGLIPLNGNFTVSAIRNKAQAFDLLEACVARTVPYVLLLSAKCLKAKVEFLYSGEYNDTSRKSQTQMLKAKAKRLSTFAGLIKYQIAEDIRLEFETVVVSIR